MSLPIYPIENVYFDDSYGGTMYDLKIDVNFNAATTFTASFVSENGQYTITKDSLNAESPNKLTIKDKTYAVYPVSYKIQKSPSGNLLVVKYVDSSHKYLDKFNIVLEGITGERLIPLLPVEKVSNDIELGYYTPKEFDSAIRAKGIPISQKASQVLQRFGKKKTSNKLQGLYINTMGTVRDVLNYIGSQTGYIFYWDWADRAGSNDLIEGRINALNAVGNDETSMMNSFVQKVMSFNEQDGAYGKFISNYDYSCSIEDNYAYSDAVYETKNIGYGLYGGFLAGRRISLINMRFYHFNIAHYPWRNPTGGNFATDVVKNEKFLRMCAVAISGDVDIFKRYIYWNIAAKIAAGNTYIVNTYPYNKSPKQSEWGAVQYRNDLVYTIFREAINKSYLLFYKSDKVTWKELYNERKAAGDLATVNFIDKISKLKQKIAPTEFEDKGEDKKSAWMLCLNKDISLDEKIQDLYNTCRTFGLEYRRHFLYGSISGTLGSDELKKGTLSYGKYTKYGMTDLSWIYVNDSVFSSFLKNVGQYVLQTTEKEEEVDAKNPSIQEFMKGNFSNTAVPLPEDMSEEEKANKQGYICWSTEEREGSVKCDISLWKGDSWVHSDDKTATENYLITQNSAMEKSAISALKIFGFKIVGGVPKDIFTTEKSATYKFESELEGQGGEVDESKPKYDLDIAFAQQDPKWKWAMSNQFSLERVPSKYLSEDGEVELAFDKGVWMRILKDYKWRDSNGDAHEIIPTESHSLSIEKLVPIGDARLSPSWIESGLESYSISYSGSGGVTTSLVIGSRKRERQLLENKERLVRIGAGAGVMDVTKAFMPKPSVARAFPSYGIKAFS